MFAKNNLVRIIVGAKRPDLRRMDEMRVEIGMKESVKKKLVNSTRVGHVGRMGGENWENKQMTRQLRGNGGEEDVPELRCEIALIAT